KKQYSEKTAVYKKPLAELDALIQGRRYFAAQDKIAELAVKMKELDLDSRRDSIKERISQAQKAMPSGNMSNTDRGNMCYDALSICADYRPAAEMIASLPLTKPDGLRVSITDGACELFWKRTDERGVTFRVVRKQGALPASLSDGETVATGLAAPSFTDKSMQYGVKYGYAVFGERMGVFSEPAAVWAEALGELDKKLLTCGTHTGSCTFSWTLPANALGVRVIRKQGAQPPEKPDKGCTVTEFMRTTGFSDTDVENGVTYGYRLQCIYPGEGENRYSKGLTLSLRPEPAPQEIAGLSIKHKGTSFEAKWKPSDSTQKMSILRLTSGSVFMEVDEVCSVSELEARLGRNETLVTADMAAGRCGVTLERNRLEHIAVVTRSGSSVRLCRVMSVSTAAPVEIDPVNTVIKNNRLTIKLRTIPDGLKRIHYCALTKTDSTVPWADISDVGTSKLTALSVSDISAGISTDAPQEDIYITVIGEYEAGGSRLYSEPARLKRNNSPRARISYKLTSSILGDKHILKMKAECESLPEMYLVYSKAGVPTDITSGDTVTVMTIPAGENTSKGYTDTALPKDVWESIPHGAKIRLLIDKADTFDYEMSPKELAGLKK
ncbi:MAG: hypothetical protein IKR76_10410, partial [Ruminococcus sp.]|nr:hypothetical protein [Ruminococcus sp.]